MVMTKKKIQTLKGFRDFLPPEAMKRQWLIDQITSTFELWGYDPLETPTLEPLELFEGQIGEDEKLFFKFEDPGGRQVALRYDQTVPACRVVGQYFQELPTPFKRYQIQPAYRAEKPQKGRFREFLQCDADIFGFEGPEADAEVIALSLDIYRRLGFPKAVAKINDRKLLKGIPYEAISAIDKMEKVGKKGVLSDMKKKGISDSDAKKYLKQIDEIKPNETIEVIFKYLKDAGFEKDWYEFDPTIARSFSYSTGPIWEIKIPEYEAGSVLGGERFDKLVKEVSGKDVPATGFAVGFDRTLQAAEQLKLVPEFTTSTKVLVTIFGDKTIDASNKAVQLLRKSGINSELYVNEKDKMAKQLKYADKKGIPYAVIIGPDEILKESVVLKDLINKTQETIPLLSLPTRIN